jgi:hypothetical protein
LDWLSRGLDGLLKLWERGKALLWALAAICVAVFAILFVGAFLGIAEAASAFQSYALWLVLAGAVFAILAAIKTIETRYQQPTVHLIPETMPIWSQSQQPDGRVTTQFSFRMQATNLTDMVIQLSEVRVSRPWTRARILANVLVTRDPNPNVNTFAHKNPILPRAISEASCTIMFDGAIGRQGKPMTAVVKVSDQFGRWHKVKFRLIEARGKPRR